MQMLQGNTPTMAEIRYVAAYLDRQLHAFESQEFGTHSDLTVAGTISRVHAIQQSIADLASDDGGNYQGLIEA